MPIGAAESGRGASSSARGAWAEAIAAAWLIQNGWEVYTGFSGQEECDMVAVRRGGGGLLRVEVKAGTLMPTGKFAVSIRRPDAFDMLLVVGPDGTVYQDPGPDLCLGIKRRPKVGTCQGCGKPTNGHRWCGRACSTRTYRAREKGQLF